MYVQRGSWMSEGIPDAHLSIWPLTKVFSIHFANTAIFGGFLRGKVYHNSILLNGCAQKVTGPTCYTDLRKKSYDLDPSRSYTSFQRTKMNLFGMWGGRFDMWESRFPICIPHAWFVKVDSVLAAISLKRTWNLECRFPECRYPRLTFARYFGMWGGRFDMWECRFPVDTHSTLPHIKSTPPHTNVDTHASLLHVTFRESTLPHIMRRGGRG